MEKKEIRVIDATATIELSKTFAKAAQYYGTKEFNTLQKVKALYPTYAIKAVNTHKRQVATYSLSYDFMRSYIEKHDASKMVKFDMLRAKTVEAEETKSKSVRYGEIKKWFLREFPEFKEFYAEQKNILDSVKKAA